MPMTLRGVAELDGGRRKLAAHDARLGINVGHGDVCQASVGRVVGSTRLLRC